MAIAEGRTLPFVGPEQVDVAVLETFDYTGPEQEIETVTDEFTAVCPYSGLPDFAKLTIRYVPGEKCIELKSLKYYVTSYRNVGIFQEHATAKIAEDLVVSRRVEVLVHHVDARPRSDLAYARGQTALADHHLRHWGHFA